MLELDRQVRGFVEAVRRAWVPGNTCTSWHRTESQNERVGGLSDSLHLLSLAIDVTGPQLARFERNCTAEGLITVPEPDHLHVQAFEAFRVQEAREALGAPPEPMATLRDMNVWLNELLGGEGGQTMSARMGERIRTGDATAGERALCGVLDMIDPDHCERAAESYLGADLQAEYDDHKHGRCRRCHCHPDECECDEPPCTDEPWWLRPGPGDEDDD